MSSFGQRAHEHLRMLHDRLPQCYDAVHLRAVGELTGIDERAGIIGSPRPDGTCSRARTRAGPSACGNRHRLDWRDVLEALRTD